MRENADKCRNACSYGKVLSQNYVNDYLSGKREAVIKTIEKDMNASKQGIKRASAY